MPEDNNKTQDALPQTREELQTLITEAVSQTVALAVSRQLPKTVSRTVAEALKNAEGKKTEEAGAQAEEPAVDSPLAGELAKLQRQLETERKEREKLHAQLVEKERRAEETDRYSKIRTLLAESKATKVDLAFKAVKDDIYRGEDGELYAKLKGEDVPAGDYVAGFLKENPEFLPPRIAGGAGSSPNRNASGAREVQLEDIKPGASPEVLEAARKKVSELVGAMRSGETLQ